VESAAAMLSDRIYIVVYIFTHLFSALELKHCRNVSRRLDMSVSAECLWCVGQVSKPSSTAKNSEQVSTLRAHTGHGSITVVCQDWVSSLKLGQFMDAEESD